jgi:acetyltransferase
MGLYNLEKIFRPESIAVVGTSAEEGSIGSILLRNLVQGGYQGAIFPIDPERSYINELKAYPSLAKTERAIDLAVIATPIHTVPSTVRECVQAGVGGAVIVSAGGRETGAQGLELENDIVEAGRGGLRILGPNSLGIICPGRRLNASLAGRMTYAGKLAFVSQSGAIAAAIIDLSLKEKIGFSYFVSIGSMLDVDYGDLIDYLGNDPEVKSILLYIETLTNFRKFMSAARAVSRVKPIVVLKSGRSVAGARAAATHTGVMAGEDLVYDAAFKRAGIVRVSTIGELFDCAELVAKQPRPPGPRLGVITNAGGPGIMAADALARYGLEPAVLEPETTARLDRILPPPWRQTNPIDLQDDATPERYASALDICLQAKELHAVLVILAPQAITNPTVVAELLTQALKGRPYPIFTCWMGGLDVEEGRRILKDAGIPTYDTPERAIQAFIYMYEYSRNMEMLQETPPKLSRSLHFDHARAKTVIDEGLKRKTGLLMETESKELVAAYGIPVTRTEVASSVEETLQLARDMEPPLVMKVHSPDIVHKTEAAGVQLNLWTENDIREAYRKILEGTAAHLPQAKILGVTLQPMIQHIDFQLILGAKRDQNFGPVILFGMGGLHAEVLRDRAIGLPPLNRLLARRLMENTRIYPFLRGYRNLPPANLELLEEMIIRLSQLVLDFPQIAELDMNPVLVSYGRPRAVDARAIVRPSDIPSPLHLVISPYPAHYETRTITTAGLQISVRPIKPEDAPLLANLFNTLSQTSIYYRFFSSLKSLSIGMLARLTQVDYDREIALAALEEGEAEEKMLGVARVIADPDGKRAEFSVLVGDPWHGKGVGARLLELCLRIAKERGIDTVWGIVLRENTQMLALGRKLGFTASRSSDPGEFELTINLKSVHFDRSQEMGGKLQE